MLEFFKCFNVKRPVDLVRYKMLHPQRTINVAAICNRKSEIRTRLRKEHGYKWDAFGRVYKPKLKPESKPRIRYKLRLRRKYTIHKLPNGIKYGMLEYVYMTLLCSLFFLSSVPAEAQYASVSGSWDHVHVVDGRWLSPNRAAYDRPAVFKAYSPFEVRHPKIRFLVGYPRLIDDTAGWRMYAKHLEKQAQYDALVDGPRVVARDWRKFWAWLIAIGTIGLATVSAISYGRWRSMK